MTKQEICGAVVRSLDRHKAEQIRVLKIGDLTSLADYFVIAEGTGSTHVRSLSDHVEEELKVQGVEPLRTEGYGSSSWILLDYAEVVVHIFTPEARQYYDLERLWKDGVAVDPAEFLENEADPNAL